MFSRKQKEEISQAIETILLNVNHPEMPSEKPDFKLHVKGKESSWANIEPNWKFGKDNPPSINPHNELIDDDPTPWCHVCGAMTSKNCNCDPIADNE